MHYHCMHGICAGPVIAFGQRQETNSAGTDEVKHADKVRLFSWLLFEADCRRRWPTESWTMGDCSCCTAADYRFRSRHGHLNEWLRTKGQLESSVQSLSPVDAMCNVASMAFPVVLEAPRPR